MLQVPMVWSESGGFPERSSCSTVLSLFSQRGGQRLALCRFAHLCSPLLFLFLALLLQVIVDEAERQLTMVRKDVEHVRRWVMSAQA